MTEKSSNRREVPKIRTVPLVVRTILFKINKTVSLTMPKEKTVTFEVIKVFVRQEQKDSIVSLRYGKSGR